MSFHVGQKVVCVDVGSYRGRWLGGEAPALGAVYTITAIGISFGRVCVQLAEISRVTDHPCSERGVWGYNAKRFRPIVERKTDISIFTEILRKVTRKDRVKA